jgi:hypothetical protein
MYACAYWSMHLNSPTRVCYTMGAYSCMQCVVMGCVLEYAGRDSATSPIVGVDRVTPWRVAWVAL